MKRILLGIFLLIPMYLGAQQLTLTGFEVNNSGDVTATELTVSGGIIQVREQLIDYAAASATNIVDSDVSTATLVLGATSWTVGDTRVTNILEPRNVTADVDFSRAEATTTVTGTLVVTGTNAQGTSTTDTLTISTNAATGVVAFSQITSVAWTITAISGGDTATGSTDDGNLEVGSGNVIGLANGITAAADVYKVIEDGADISTYTANATYNTIDFATDPDASNDYVIYYRADDN